MPLLQIITPSLDTPSLLLLCNTYIFLIKMFKSNPVSALRRNGQELLNQLGERNEKAIYPGYPWIYLSSRISLWSAILTEMAWNL